MSQSKKFNNIIAPKIWKQVLDEFIEKPSSVLLCSASRTFADKVWSKTTTRIKAGKLARSFLRSKEGAVFATDCSVGRAFPGTTQPRYLFRTPIAPAAVARECRIAFLHWVLNRDMTQIYVVIADDDREVALIPNKVKAAKFVKAFPGRSFKITTKKIPQYQYDEAALVWKAYEAFALTNNKFQLLSKLSELISIT